MVVATPDGAHRVHGIGTGLVAPAWPAITAAEAEAILACYPVAGRLVALRWHSPRPFSAATLVETGGGAFFLKRHHRRLRTLYALAPEHAFVAHLAGAGLSVPEIIVTDNGATAIALGDWTYELHRKAPGLDLYRDRPSWTPFLAHGHAQAAGAALARLHVAARGFDAPDRDPQPLVASLTILTAPDPLAAAQDYVAARPALAAFLADRPWRGELAALLAANADGLGERLAAHPSLWTHNDWHPSNLLWTPAGDVRTIFDFGLATRTCALHDLATAIERTAIEWLGLGERDDLANAGAARATLDGYRIIRPLSAADLATLVQLLPLVHIEFALSEIDYFAGIVGRPDQAAAAWDDYLIGHAQWFRSRPGRAFLDQLAED